MPNTTVPAAATGLPIAHPRGHSLMASHATAEPNRSHMGTVEAAQISRTHRVTQAGRRVRHDIVTVPSIENAGNVSSHALQLKGGGKFPPPSDTPRRRAEREVIRARIETAIEKLIAALDAMDPDPELEPSNEGAQPADGNPATVDAEGDGSDDEETLGWPENVSQAALGNNTADGDATAPERTAWASFDAHRTITRTPATPRRRTRTAATTSRIIRSLISNPRTTEAAIASGTWPVSRPMMYVKPPAWRR